MKLSMNEAKDLSLLDESLGVSDAGGIESQHQLENHLAEKITGRLDGLRHTILSLVVEGRYDTAIAEISYYANSDLKLDVFKGRSQRYFNHCEELIRAVESKMKFCNTRTITRSQKHQLYLMVIKHFQDLTESLKKVERIENDIRVADLKSTVWVLKALIASMAIVILFAMIYEGVMHMPSSLNVVGNDFVNMVFGLFGM